MNKILILLFVTILFLTSFFVTEVISLIPSQNITLNTPANNTYVNTSRPNFNFTFIGENETYKAELFINGTGYGLYLINDSLISNITSNTSLVDGNNYTWYINISNGTQSNLSNQTRYFTIDTTKPLITYEENNGLHSIVNNTNWSQSFYRVNVSYTEINFDNVTFNLFDGSWTNINGTKFNGSSNRALNFTSLADDIYTLNVTVVDLANNRNASTRLTFTIDTTKPLITYVAGINSLVNNTNWSQNTFYLNVSYTELHFDNVTFNLLNSSGVNINGTKFNESSNRALNFTSLADGVYRMNVTVVDTANNTNTSTQLTFTIDTTKPLITYEENGLHTITNNTYLNQSTLRVNVSYTETYFDNVTFNLLNSSGVNINGTKFNGSSNRALNFTSLADGVYRMNVTVVDTANNTNSSEQRTFTIDTTIPLLSFNSTTVGNNSNLTVKNAYVEGIFSDTNFANVTVVLTNSSTGAVLNTTVFTSTSTTAINFSNLGDGNYTVNLTVTDLANNKNYTINRFFTVDLGAPNVTLTVSSSSIYVNDAVTLTCTVHDHVDPSPATTLNVKKPGQSSYSVITAGSYKDTSGTGTYALRCTSVDAFGNSYTAESSFVVSESGSSSSSSSSSSVQKNLTLDKKGLDSIKNRTQNISSNTIFRTSTIDSISLDSVEAWPDSGEVSYSTVEGDVYTFLFSGEEHSIVISKVEVDSVTFIVESTPQEVTLIIGESRELDISEDGTIDLRVTLQAITDGVADLVFTQVGETWKLGEVEVSTKGSRLWLWIVFAVLIVGIGLFFVLKVKSMGNSKVNLRVKGR